MTDRPWMPLDIEDYLTDTAHLSAAEHGAYMLLIMRYWRDGGLPEDERLIQRYSRLTADQWLESRDVIAAFFHDGWKHRRIDAEITKASDIIEKRRAAAKAKHSSSKSGACAEQVPDTSSDTRVPPVTDNQPSSLRSDGARARKPNPIIVLQAEVDSVAAQRWVTHCEEKGKKPSVAQAEQQCGVLREIRDAGGNPTEAIRFAIDKGWSSLQLEYFVNNGFPFKAPPAAMSTAHWPPEKWRPLLAHWRETGNWNRDALGPAPDEPGCKAPPELMRTAA